MNYKLTKHAEIRMKERLITIKQIEDALRNPTRVGYDIKNKLLIKKLYKQKGKERLLIMVGRQTKTELIIITIIDTSKIEKYL